MDYPHGVMDELLVTPHGTEKLPPNWALQNPQDYLDVLAQLHGTPYTKLDIRSSKHALARRVLEAR